SKPEFINNLYTDLLIAAGVEVPEVIDINGFCNYPSNPAFPRIWFSRLGNELNYKDQDAYHTNLEVEYIQGGRTLGHEASHAFFFTVRRDIFLAQVTAG